MSDSPSPPVLEFEKDAAILSHLLHNGRISLNRLAEQIDEYRQKLWRRQKELEDDVIWGYTAVIDEQKVGWRRYIIRLRVGGGPSGSMDGLRRGFQEWHSLRTVNSYIVSGGDHNYVVEIICRTPFDLKRYLDVVRTGLGRAMQGEPVVEEVVFAVRQSGFVNPDVDRVERLLSSLRSLQPAEVIDGGL